MLHTIISGGQTGADQAGLRAGRALGLRTGGWATRGFRTLDGSASWLAEYGLREAATTDYPTRTAMNVRDSDATVRFARDFDSSGERCTLKAIQKHKKPHLDVLVVDAGVLKNAQAAPGFDAIAEAFRVHAGIANGFVGLLRAFLIAHNVSILNVAGNTEQTAPGIGVLVEAFLVRALRPR